jgi:hypothetical protein
MRIHLPPVLRFRRPVAVAVVLLPVAELTVAVAVVAAEPPPASRDQPCLELTLDQ